MRRPVASLYLGFLFATTLSGCVQPAKVDLAIGSVVTPGNTQVPLPVGNWQKLAEQKTLGGRFDAGGTNNSHYVESWYGLVESGRLKSIVYVNTDVDAGLPTGYVPNSACLRNDLPRTTYLHEVNGTTTNNSDCLKVEYSRSFNPPNNGSSAGYRAFYQAATPLGGVSRRSIKVSFCESLGSHYLNYYAYFFPELDGIQGNQWDVGNEGPAEKAYVQDVVSWAKRFRPAVRNGSQNLLR